MLKKIFLLFYPYKLGSQLAILISFCLTSAILSYGWYVSNQQSQALIDHLHREAEGLAKHLSITLGSHILMNDYINLEKILISAAKATPVEQIQLIDNSGLIITDIRQSEKGPTAEFLDQYIIPPAPHTRPALSITDTHMVLWHPVAIAQPLGWLRLDYSLAAVHAMQARIRAESVMAALAAITVSLTLLALFLSPRLAALKKIRLFAETMTTRLGQHIEVNNASAEIALLEQAMNDASTRLAHADDALKKSEEQVRLLLESTAEAILGFDVNYKCTFVNPACLRMLGYDHSSEVIGQKATNILLYTHANGKPLEFNASPLAYTMNTGIGNHAEDLCIIRPHGERFPIEYWSYPIHHNGRLVGAVVTFVDITERKNTEKALWRSEKIFRDFAEKIPSVFWMISPNGERMIYISPAYEEIWGRSAQELYRRPTSWLDAVHEDDIAQLIAQLPKRLTGEYDVEYRIVRPDFTIRWIRDRGFPIFDGAGQIDRIAGIAADVTARKQAEQTQREHQAALAVQSALEAQNEEFREARLQALRASKAKSDFLANVSHEIRTPMHAILGFTNILLRTRLSNDQRQYIDTIEHSASTLLNIINNILDFSKIEAGKVNFENTDFDVGECIEYVLNLLTPKALHKGLKIFPAIGSDIHKHVWGDATRLKQVLTNLVDNAIKFTFQGSITLQLQQIAESKEKVTLEFKIIDTGIGIPSDQQGGLFSTFFQVDRSETRPYGGTGLGLAICKKIIEHMGGEIGVDSDHGKGSTFWIKLSFKKSIRPNETRPPEHLLGEVKVLLCDWHPISRVSLAQTLRNWQMQVADVGHIKDVWDVLEQAVVNNQAFDVLIIAGSRANDELLICRAIQSLKKLYSCHVVVLHPGAEQGHPRQTKPLGADAYLPRHCRPADLYKELTQLVAGKPYSLQIHNNLHKQKTSSRKETFSLHGKHILVADDNIINRTLLITLLHEWGAQTSEAENGKIALQMIQSLAFDMVLLDIHMPTINGLEVAAMARNSGNRVPIVALTADMLIREKEGLSRSEFNDILVKPVSETTIKRVMKNWLIPTKKRKPQLAVIQPPPLIEQTQVYDEELSLRLANGKRELAHELLQMLLAELPNQRDQISTLTKNQDFQALKQVVHKIHGSASYCGLPALKAAAAFVEKQLVISNSHTSVLAALTTLDNEIERVLHLSLPAPLSAPI